MSGQQVNQDKLGTFTSVVPNSVKFSNPLQGPPGERVEFKFPPLTGSYTSTSGGGGDNIVRFVFPSANIIDFTRAAFAFDLTLVAPGSTYKRIHNGIWSIINRLRLRTSGELEDIREYNRFYNLHWEIFRNPDVGSVLGEVYGWGTQFERNVWGNTASKDYMMPLHLGLFFNGVLPMQIFTQKLELELYLADPRTCVETDSPGPVSFTLTNIYFHYDVLQLEPSFEKSIISTALGGVRYPYKTYVYYQAPLTQAREDILIPHSSTGIECFIHVMVRSDNINDMTANDKFLMWPSNDLREHTLRANNKFYPAEPALAGEDPQTYYEFLKHINKWLIGGVRKDPPTITFSEFSSTKTIIISSVETFPGEGLVNNFSTVNSGNNVFLRIQLGAAPAVPTMLVTFAVVARSIDLVGTKLMQ